MKKIFLIRTIIDLDYNLPLIENLDNVEIWLRNKIDFSEIHKLSTKHAKIFNIYTNNYISRFNFFKYLFLKKNYLKKLRNCENGSVFFIDHDWNNDIHFIIKLIRENINNSKIVLIPHGMNLFQNKILDYNIYDNEKYDISNIDYDYFISNDHHFESLYILKKDKKNIFFPTWRYTINEVNKRYFFKKNSEHILNNCYNILLYHTKKIGNINWPNLIRAIKIINKHTNFKLYIKPHPRGGGIEAKELIIDKYRNELIKTTIDQSFLNYFDFYIVLSSSVILDLLLLKKKIIILAFVTGNIFNEDILNRCIVINSPEELIEFCKDNKYKVDYDLLDIGKDFDKNVFLTILDLIK
jgi:hypothetical protein